MAAVVVAATVVVSVIVAASVVAASMVFSVVGGLDLFERGRGRRNAVRVFP